MTEQEFKQLKIEGANIVLLEYPDEKIGVDEVLEVINNLQNELGQDWQVVAMPDKTSVYTFPLQKFLDYLGKKVCRWEAHRVFLKEKPTKEKVVALYKAFLKGLEE